MQILCAGKFCLEANWALEINIKLSSHRIRYFSVKSLNSIYKHYYSIYYSVYLCCRFSNPFRVALTFNPFCTFHWTLELCALTYKLVIMSLLWFLEFYRGSPCKWLCKLAVIHNNDIAIMGWNLRSNPSNIPRLLGAVTSHSGTDEFGNYVLKSELVWAHSQRLHKALSSSRLSY